MNDPNGASQIGGKINQTINNVSPLFQDWMLAQPDKKLDVAPAPEPDAQDLEAGKRG